MDAMVEVRLQAFTKSANPARRGDRHSAANQPSTVTLTFITDGFPSTDNASV